MIDVAAARDLFEASTDGTVGIEEEFALLDQTLCLTPAFERLRDAGLQDPILHDAIAGELISSEIEIRSGRGEDFEDARRRQHEARRRLFTLAAQQDVVGRREGEQAAAGVVLAATGVLEVLAAAGADLDLAVDQLAGDGLGQHVVGHRRVVQLHEAVGELEAVGVDQRELLLDADGEVGGGLEDLPDSLHVQAGVGQAVRRGRSRGHRAGRRPGSRCAPSPRAGPSRAARSS